MAIKYVKSVTLLSMLIISMVSFPVMAQDDEALTIYSGRSESLIGPFSTKRFTLFYLHNTVILEPFTAKNSC